MIQLSCVSHPLTDPELYCALNTILSFRDFHTPDMAHHTMQQIIEGGRSTPGPCKSFLQAIHTLQWRWQGGDTCVDQNALPIHILRCPRSELSERVIIAWQQFVQGRVEEERTTFKGMVQADVKLTKGLFRSQPSEHQGLLRCALNGTQYTHDALFHAGKVESKCCKFCGAPDSLLHRNVDCTFFQDIRDQHPMLDMLPTMPSCTLCHGWIPQASNQQRFRQALIAMPDTTSTFFWTPNRQDDQACVDLFQDGSCVRPHDPHTRVAMGTCDLDWTEF